MTIDLKKLKDSEAEMTVHLDGQELKNYIRETAEDFSRSLIVDGFRPGRAPLGMVRQKIGDQKLLEASLDVAVKNSLAGAFKEKALEVISTLDLKVIKNTPQELEYKVRLLLFPRAEIKNYKNFNLARKPIEVTPEETKEAINYILKSRAEYHETEAPVAEGDHLEIDFETSHQGKPIEGGKSENHPFIFGQGSFIPGFEKQLESAKRGERRSFSLRVPDNYYQKSIAGKELDFLVTIRSVKKVLWPELNDQFVRTLGGFSSVEDLKESVRRGLKREKEQKETERLRLEILDKIDDRSEIDVPSRLIEQQLDLTLDNFRQNLRLKGLELELYLAHLKKTEEDLKKEWRPQAVRQVRHGLILREIGRLENIEVGEQEVETAAADLASQILLREGPEEKKDIDLETLKTRVYESLLSHKVFDYLEKANVS